MADAKISALVELLGSELSAPNDRIPIVDTSEAQTKYIEPEELLKDIACTTVTASGAVTIGGVLTVADGAVGAPAITNAGDTDTGLYFSAADQVSIATAGRWCLQCGATGIVQVQPLTTEATLGTTLSAIAFTSSLTGWTVGAGWAWDEVGYTGAEHTSGGGTNTLVSPSIAIDNSTHYRLTFTVAGRTTGSVTLSMTNAAGYLLPAVSADGTLDTTFKSSSTSTVLTFTPTDTFNGTITAITIQKITAAAVNALNVLNSDGSVGGVQFKAGGSGLHNFFSGTNCGNQTVIGANNIGIGNGALRDVTHGSSNVAFGSQALLVCTTGGYNFAINGALSKLTSGNYNIGIGYSALGNQTTPSNNIGIGYTTGGSITTGYSNVAIGGYALSTLTVGVENTAIGHGALVNLSTSASASGNVAIGVTAGKYQADGSTALATAANSVYIGSGARGYNNSDSNTIVIGYSAIGLGANMTTIGNSSTTIALLYGAHRLSTVAAPTAVADNCFIYSADQTAGNACPHILTENNKTLKLFQGAAVADATDASSVILRLNELLAHLRLMGVIAT